MNFVLVVDDGMIEHREEFETFDEAREAWRKADAKVKTKEFYSAAVMEYSDNGRPKQRLYSEQEE